VIAVYFVPMALFLALQSNKVKVAAKYYFIHLCNMNKKFDQKLQQRNVKPTAMRELVIEILLEQKTAISLKDLEDKFDKADKSTLYRTLKTFEDKKVIHSIEVGTGSVKYAICVDTCECNPSDLHVHFHCTKCQRTYCLNDIPIPEIKLPIGFNLDSVNMVVKGLCVNCKN